MTTIITRLFADQDSAHKAADRLIFNGIPARSCTIIAGGDDAETRLAKKNVHKSAMETYKSALADGSVALVVEATYKPLGAARLTRDILASFETLEAGSVKEMYALPWQPDHAQSILKDHPRFFSFKGMSMSHGPKMASSRSNLVKAHSTKRPLTAKRSSTAFWPMALISHKHRRSSVYSGGRHMSKAFWPMPLISNAPRKKSVIPGGGFPFSRALGFPTVS